MDFMFSGCSKLTSLDVSKFDTSKVTDMSWMFSNCSQLTSLDVNNFNTTNVTSMDGMFSGCSKLTSLDVSGFDTSKVKTMGFMFSACNSLKNIDLRSFDTSSLDGETYNSISGTVLGVDVNNMFERCENLESIIIGDKFNRLDGYEMFDGCNKLKAIITTKTITASSDAPTLSGTENVTNSNGEIIAGPNGLIDLPNAILYAPDTASEKFYEAATNYATTFADSRDTEGDLYRVRPILEVAGENPVKVKIGETYDASVDAGATIAGFGVTDSGEYTQYGYNYTTVGLPVDTTTKGTKQVTYTLTKTENETTTNGMTATRDINVVSVPMLMERESSDYINGKGTVYYAIGAKRSGNKKYTADLISTITFVNNTNIPTTAEANWDVSYTSGDGDVIAWVIPNTEDSIKYDLYIGANDTTIQAPVNAYRLFADYTNCMSINNLQTLNTTNVISMRDMFAGCRSLTSLDVSNFNTSNVTKMSSMFHGCNKLASLDLSGFDTEKVTDTKFMFSGCNSLISLDISSLDTGNVTDMQAMFASCSSLTSLDISSLNTGNVTNMGAMFSSCSGLISLDVSGFDTSNVTNMGSMFSQCSSLTSLNINGINTNNVTNMSYMFYSCSKLANLDVSELDTSKVIAMNWMFYSCSGLTTLDASNFDTSNVTNMGYMFEYCNNLTSLDVSGFDTSNVTDMRFMFNGCSKLTSLDVSGFNTSSVTNMNCMFDGCSKLTSLDVSGFDTSKVKTMGFMFSACNSLKNIDLRSFDTSSLDGKTCNSSSTALGVDVNYMFWSCGNLESVIVGDKFNRLDGYDMFKNCNKLKAIITTKTITTSSDAPILSGTENVTNSNGKIIAGPNGLIDLPNAILYAPDIASEKLYEAATNYATTFADSRDTEGDLYRVRPILEVAGENPVKVKIGETYDASVDAGATIAGFGVADSGEYTQYGYNYTTSGLPVDTTTKGTKQVTYTLTKTENGTTINGMTATRDVKVVGVPMLMERESYDYINGKGMVYYAIGAKKSGNTKYTADLISTITFVNNTNIPTTAEANWDVSYTSGDGDVIAWVVPNTTDSTKYDLFIGADATTIEAPIISSNLFGEYKNCTVINNLTMLDTSKVTDMTWMFYNCSNLTELNVSNFDTTNVTNMSYMFYYCGSLTNLDVSKFDTSNVTSMSWMFSRCNSLTSLDINKFNTSNVTDMSYMFYKCENLTVLEVINFNTSNVTSMYYMFNNCRSLTNLDVSKFDTSKVTDRRSMFYWCSYLTSLDVSNFNTSNVTNMGNMFDDCSKLTSLDVSGLDTSKVKTMGYMFSGCTNLKNIDLRSLDTSSLDGKTYNSSSAALGVDVNYMFMGCENLESIIIGDKFNRLDGYDMFDGCNKLKAIITTKTITTSSDAPILSGIENVTNSNGQIIAGPNGLIDLPNAILYAPDTTSEKLYEAATNYSTTFADSRDTEGDLYRIRPILEVAGENPVKVKIGETYDATVDAGATIAGFGVADSGEYTQYGYNYTTSGLPVDTTTKGTKQVTYTLTKTENGTTTNGMTATRDVEVYKIDINNLEVKLGSEEETYIDSEIKPTVTVTSGDKTLTEDVDYKVSYKDNVDVGTATVTIEGIGEYEGTVEKTFTIVKRKITLKVKDVSKVYDGTALTSDEYEITAGELISGHVLTIKTTGSQINVGTSTNTVSSVTIKNAANKDVTSNYDVTSLSGSLEVTEKGASDITAELGTTVYTYDGTAKEPTATVKDGTKILTAGTDYDIEYKDNVNAGTATVTITLKGNYSGTITKTFTIERAKTATVTVSDKIYTGATQTGVVGTNVDLTGTTSATNVGTYTATATPKTNYAWADGTITSKALTWKITAKSGADITASLSSTTYVYDGTPKEPTVTVKDGTKVLVAGTDYDVEYKNNVNAGTATVTITLKGNYNGTITLTFTIERAKTATVTASDKVYTGANQVGVIGTNVDLVGTTSATNVGTYTATATPKTNYAWADGAITSKTLTWKITEKSGADITASLSSTTYVYDGTAKEPTVTVKDGTKVLVAGTDYDVKYIDNVNAGTATVRITLKGNYSGTITKTFTIERAKTATATASDKIYTGAAQTGVIGVNVDLTGTITATEVGTYTATATPKTNYAWADGTITSKTLTWKITAKSGADITASLSSTTYVYDGTPKEPTVTVKDGTKTLVAGTDYDVEYKNNVNAGTATVTITLKGNYNGTITLTFTIERAKTATVTASDKVYTGVAQTGVTGVNVNLVGVLSATNVGTYTATATPKSNYAWADGSTTSRTLTWKITAKSGADITASLSSTTYVYDGTAKEPTVTVKDGTKTLVAVTDYDVKYIDNVNAGTATVTITLKGNYEGTIEKTFTIERAKTATATASDKTYTGTEQIGVTGVNVDLTGTISATNVGTYTATATPKANYAWADGSTDAKTLTWKITEKASSDIVATLGETVYTYDGTAKEPTVTVKDGTKTLVEGTDYDVEYKDNINAGTATVTITLKGNYNGTIIKNFTIERAKTATATASDKIYTGAAQTGVIGVNVDLTGTITATNVGTYTATATPKTNYAWADGTITSKTLTWKITAKSGADITASLSSTTYVYDGTAKEPTVTVKDGTKTLVAGTDYDVKYIDNVSAGTATVRITLKGNYSGTITKTFTIERAKTATAIASNKTYTGAAQVGVTGVNVDLKGTVSATAVGTYTATATPKANYAWADGSIDERELVWEIVAKGTDDITAILAETVYTYDGTAKEPTVTVKDGTKVLVAGTDYNVEYKDNLNAGTATVEITLSGNYSGTIIRNFTIERAKTATATASDKIYTGTVQTGVTGVNVDLTGTITATAVGTYTATATPKANYAWADGSTDAKTLTWKITEKTSSDIVATLGETVYTYDGTAKEPTVTVKDGTKTLVEGTDYDVEYKDNVNAGTATVTITLKGNYSGTITKNFTIERAKTATAIASDKVYTGSEQTGVTGTNVDLFGTISATDVGTYTATATPKANYAWSDGSIEQKILTWNIIAKDTMDITATLNPTVYTYDGTEKEPEVTVKDGTKVLVNVTDYDVEYSNNINAGTATVTITLKGNYSGTITKTFTIERAKTATATASDKIYTGELQTGVTGTHVNLIGMVEATNVGTYTVTATPRTNYAWADGSTDAKTLTWKITAKGLDDMTASLTPVSFEYDGTAKEPMAEVKDGENTLLNKTDYDVKYSNNINVGTAIATITFKGNYTGTLTREFTITARKITVKAKDVSKPYNGSALTSDVTEVVSGSLVEGHVITAQTTGSQIDVGTSTNVLNSVTISDALGNDVTENYDITTENGTLEVIANSNAKFDITLSNDSFEYDGTAKEPIATVKVDGKVLTEGVDYKVVYQDNVDAGTAKVIIEGIGNFEGSIGEKTFEIIKANITGSVEIIGKNIFGETLTANTNCNPSESTITYQWWYSSSSTATSGTLIPNATNKDYRIGDDLAAGTLIGKYIGVTVKFSNGNNYNEKTAYDITTSDDNENATTKKADRTIELIDSKSVIRGTTTDVSFTYTGEASSTSVTSSAADKATATVTDSENGGTIKVTAVGVGTANITLTVAESQDYNAASKICVISIKSDNSNLMVRELGEYEAGTGTIYYVIGAQRAGKKQYKADLIKTITFVQGNEVPANAVDSWDVSFNNGDYNVRAWVIKNSSDNSMYDLYIGADSKIVAPSISDRMFRAYTNCISINGLEFLDTSKATSMNYMFMDSDSLTTLDLSYFDTSKVTQMMYMFSGCKALKNVDLSSFDTTNVTTMTAMFRYCENMTDVTFGNSFKTNKVTDMSYMFSRCSKLTKIDLSKFDTSSATNMEQMFAHCNSIKELQLQQFNTNKVTTMSSMFNDCSSLTKLDLSSFNTNNVTNMSGLFGGCVNLETITFGKNFETSKVEDMSSMFSGCAKLSNLNVSEFNTSKVTNMANMFKGCSSITALDISNFDTSKVTNMHSMFENCGNLKAIHLGEMFDTSKVTDMKYMFSGNSKLTAIIARRTISSVDNAIKFSTDTGLNNLYDAILYVPNEESEKLYEKSENYSTIFGHAEDTADDLYRVRPILELIGENPVSVSLGKTYNESTDSGVTIAGFDKDNASGYTQFGYNYTVTGLPVDTSKEDTKEVVYTLTYTRPGTTTTISEMKAIRTVEVVGKNIGALEANLPQNSYEYTGSQITPEPTVKDGNVILEKGVDYEITYGDNLDVGYGTVTITGKGSYTGSKTLTFEITLAKMTGRVVIKGINKVGNVLTVDTSKIVPTGCTLTYQWYFSNDATMINGTAIDGETTDKYTLKDSNIGKYIYVEVIASKKNYETHKFTDVTDASNNNYDMVVGNVDRKPTIRFEEKQVSTDSVEITVIIKTVSGVTRVTVNNSVIDKSRYQNSITKTNYEITTTFKYTALVNGVFVFEVEDEIGNITKETLNISTIGTSAPKITYKKYNATYYDKAKIIFESDTLVKIFAPESYVADGITFSTNYYSTKIVATIAEGTTFDEDKTFTFINEKSDVIGVTVEAPIYTKNVYIRMAKEATNPLNITIKEACMLAENMTNSKALIGAKVDSYYGIKGTTKVNVATGKELDVAEKLGSSTKTMSYNTKGGLDETPTTSLTTGTSGNYMNNNITGIYVKTSGLLDVLTLITSSLEKYTTFRITIRP